jgi:threonine dehydratase
MLETPTANDAWAAFATLEGHVVRTPVLSGALLHRSSRPVYAKAEGLQLTGSFKVRGALNRVRTLSAEALQCGLLTVSAGNAALGTAYAAKQQGVPLTVVMPQHAVPEKLAAVRGYGAEVRNEGVTDAAAAFALAEKLQAERGLTFVHPFDDPMVIAGAATATMELLQERPSLDRLYVPCSGGGLLAGAVLAARALDHGVTLIGVQPEGANTLSRSLAAGQVVEPADIKTVADGLTAPRPGTLNFAMIQEAGIDVITVPEQAILSALETVVRGLRVVVEPSAAVPLAGLALDADADPEAEVALMLSGSNVNWQLLADQLILT